MSCGLTQTVGAVYGEAHQDDICIWVGQGPETVIVLLSSCVPKSQLHLTDGQQDKEGRTDREEG